MSAPSLPTLVLVRHAPKCLWAYDLETGRYLHPSEAPRHDEGQPGVAYVERNADLPLLPGATEHAAHIAHELLDHGILPVRCIVSPAKRTCETARLVLAGLGLTLVREPDERLHERRNGVLDQVYGPTYMRLHPEEASRHREEGTAFYRPPGASETLPDVVARVTPVLRELHGTPGPVLIVTHHFLIKAMLCVVEGCTTEASQRASLGRFRVTQGGYALVRDGRLAERHLRPE